MMSQIAPTDGLGWWLEYVCNLMKYYPQLTQEYILYEMPMELGWAYVSWAVEHDSMLNMKRSSKGYIRMEADKLVEEFYAVYPKEIKE